MRKDNGQLSSRKLKYSITTTTLLKTFARYCFSNAHNIRQKKCENHILDLASQPESLGINEIFRLAEKCICSSDVDAPKLVASKAPSMSKWTQELSIHKHSKMRMMQQT